MDEITKALKLARHHYDNNTVDGFSLRHSVDYRVYRTRNDQVSHSLGIGRHVDSRRVLKDVLPITASDWLGKRTEIIWKRRR